MWPWKEASWVTVPSERCDVTFMSLQSLVRDLVY